MDRYTQPDFQGVLLDAQTIPQDRLNIDNKERSNLFPWNGQFSPQLVEVLLQTYAKAGCYVLDPFLGSGTVLYEAGRLGYPTFGAEINPAAFKMASTYSVINMNLAKRRRILEDVDDLLDDLTPDAAPLFATSRTRHDCPLHEALARRAAAASDHHVRGLLETLIVLLNVGDREPDQQTVQATWNKVRGIVLALPVSDAPIEVVNCDARSLPLPTARVDIVVTSPPYINVFNYHQQYRKSLELMGWDLLEVAKSEIGSNRKHRGNRFLTVTQYCLDMVAVFEELRRVCKPDARIIIVVGRESNVRKTVFFNGEIVAGLALEQA
jgi:SAM-dependent methyltransferase